MSKQMDAVVKEICSIPFTNQHSANDASCLVGDTRETNTLILLGEVTSTLILGLACLHCGYNVFSS